MGLHTVKGFRDINPKISSFILKTDNFDTVLINVHTPNEKKGEEEKDYFYVTMTDEFNSWKREDSAVRFKCIIRSRNRVYKLYRNS